MNTNMLLIASIMTLSVTMIFQHDISAETNQNILSVTPINEEISLQKTIIPMSIPADNELPWGAVTGGMSDHVKNYPVIIQIFKDKDPVHFSQVDVKEDGSYEYKFRVKSLDSDTGDFVNLFEGDYTVKIFRVIHNTNSMV